MKRSFKNPMLSQEEFMFGAGISLIFYIGIFVLLLSKGQSEHLWKWVAVIWAIMIPFLIWCLFNKKK